MILSALRWLHLFVVQEEVRELQGSLKAQERKVSQLKVRGNTYSEVYYMEGLRFRFC